MTGGGFLAGAIVGKLLLDKTGWNQSISAVDKDVAKLGGTAKNLGAKFDEIGRKMQGLGIKIAAVGGVIVASFGGMIKKTADYGDAMHDLSERTGVAVPILTSLSLAAQKSGTSMDGLARGFRLLANQMQAANTGNKTAAALFESLGIKVAGADGSLRDMNDVMLDVAGRFSGMEDGAQKAALAQDLFGRSGMELIPLLNLGADGLKREQEEAAKLGLVLSKDAADAADKFNDNLKSLGGAVHGVGIQIGTILMPAVQSLVIHLTNIIAKVREWAAAHPELVTMLSKVALGLGVLATAIGPILIALPALIRGLQALKAIAANPIVLIITTSIPILTKTVADFIYELKNMKSAMQESGQSGFVSFLDGVNSAWRRVALGIKDSNIVLSEANALAKLYATEGGKGTKDILLEEVEAVDTFTPALQAVKTATTEVIDTWAPMAAGASFVRDVMQGFAGDLTTTFIPAARDMSLVMAAAPGTFNEVGSAAEGLEYVFKAIGDAIGASAATVKVAMWNMAADVLAAYGIIIAKMPELATTAKTVTTQTKDYFAGLFNDIATGFANTIQKWLEGATTFKNFMTGLWDNIKSAFFRMIGEMVAEWVVNFVKKVILHAASAAAGVGASMATIGASIATMATAVATIIGTLITAVATGIVTFATALASALVALATGIASAATIIAAAAPAIIVTALLALGIMSALKLLERIFGSKSGAGDGMGRVVERQDVQISLLTILKDLTFNNRAILDDIKKTLWSISERFSKALGYLKDIAGATNSLSDSIDDLGHDFLVLGNNIGNGLIFLGNSFDKGLISLGNKIGKGLISVGKILDKGLISLGKIFDKVGKGGELKGAQQIVRTVEHAPNIIMPLREYRTAAASAGATGSNSNVNVTFNIRALDGTDMINVVRSKVVPILQNILNHNGLRVPTGAVGGA